MAEPAESTPKPAPSVSKVVPGSKRKSSGGFKLGGNSFDAIKQQLTEKTELQKQLLKDQQDDFTKEVNPEIEIDQVAFETQLNIYIERLKSQNKMNLASAFLNGKSSFVHNQWNLSVENGIFKDMIDAEQDILPFLRDTLAQPTLFLEVEVDEALIPKQEEIPYTEEGKLEAMNKKNPLVQKLQKIFKTRIIYE